MMANGWDDDPDGFLSILNVGAGDLKVTFDKDKPGDVEEARRTVEDMLRRGYSIFVETPTGLEKVKAFDAAAMAYVIETPAVPSEGASAPKRRGRPEGTRQVPMTSTKATAVAPSAGG